MTPSEEELQRSREDSMWLDYVDELAEQSTITLYEKYPYNFSTGDPE